MSDANLSSGQINAKECQVSGILPKKHAAAAVAGGYQQAGMEKQV